MGVAQAGDNTGFAVAISSLRVFILKDESGGWFAQGMDIDYAAQGKTLKEVKSRFEAGLTATIHEHLQAYGGLSQFLRPAPPEAWTEYYDGLGGKRLSYSQVSIHQLDGENKMPFRDIAYIEPAQAAP